VTISAAAGRLLAAPGPPVEIGRDEARELARRELADPVYREEEPSLLERAVAWILDRLFELFDAAAQSGLAGRAWLLVVAGLLVLAAVVVVRYRRLRVRRTRLAAEVLEDPTVSAAEHRRRADVAAAGGDWTAALTHRFRALVREAEERTLLDPRPGRTADEAAAELAGVLPPADLQRAARLFDAVRFGGRPAAADEDGLVRRLDDAVRRARAIPIADPAADRGARETTPGPTDAAVPR
jgi:hypothetical protein